MPDFIEVHLWMFDDLLHGRKLNDGYFGCFGSVVEFVVHL